MTWHDTSSDTDEGDGIGACLRIGLHARQADGSGWERHPDLVALAAMCGR